MRFDQPPAVRVSVDPADAPPERTWPMTIPAVAQLVREGLDLPPGVTFLVGENGSGKSTLVEAVAAAYGLSPEGGSAQGHHSTRATESPWYMFSEQTGGGPAYQQMSHGESFLEIGDWRLRHTTWEELELVEHWKAYRDSPGRHLRHVLD
jgi:predicted ATPase